MEQLGDVGHVESRFDPFGGSISFGAVHSLRETYHRLRNRLRQTGWNS
jgi:hypothetical protein